MFRGSEKVKLDDKGRLKIPAPFRQILFDQWGPKVFLTHVKPMQLTIYPLAVWEGIEQRLASMSDSLPEKNRFLLTASNFGSEKSVDDQGRLAIPPDLRQRLRLNEDVLVLGELRTLTVVNAASMQEWVEQNFPDAAVFDRLREHGM